MTTRTTSHDRARERRCARRGCRRQPEGADATSEKVDEAIEAEVIEEQGEVQEDTPNLFEAITAEVTELRDRYARLQAEWDNYRKRTQAATRLGARACLGGPRHGLASRAR